MLLGLLSVLTAAIFLGGQAEYKRMFAYSSVEHMGVLALGIGLGALAHPWVFLHAVNHSLTKAMMFLVAGNILTRYRSKSTEEVRGVLRVLPASGILWAVGLFALTGSPPFGPFLSELTILKAALDQGRAGVAIAYLILLAVIFVGMATAVLGMAQGLPRDVRMTARAREPLLRVVPAAALAAVVLLLGVYIPPVVRTALEDAARALG